MAAPLPVNLLCGYLGAGKTTLLNQMLDRSDERILVMVNDFGDIAVDAALIADRSADTIQLSNGCICCSIGGGLFEAFERALSLRDRVDRLVIEASGVAEPHRLAAFALAERDFDCRAVLAVVDPLSLAGRLADPRVGRIAHNQIAGADMIYLSRADIAARPMLRQARRDLDRINPMASQHLRLDAALRSALDRPHDRALASASGRDHQTLFCVRTIRLERPPEPERLLALLADAGPFLHRLKGCLQFSPGAAPQLLQLAGGRLTLEPVKPGPDLALNRLVAIGVDAVQVDRLCQRIEAEGRGETPGRKESGCAA